MSDPTNTVRALVVDDHAILREALVMLIGSAGITVVGTASNGAEAIEQTRLTRPDVVVMDMRMPDIDGASATRLILAEQAGIRVVSVSAHAEIEWVSTAFDAGARAFVLKDYAYDDLVPAIRAALSGDVFVSPRIPGAAAFLRERFSASRP